MPKKQAIVLYMPVLHKGYMDLFRAHPKVQEVYVIGQDLLDEVDYLRKDLRALTPKQQATTLEGLGALKSVKVLSPEVLKGLDIPSTELIMPDEDICRELAGQLKNATATFYPVFLRWDRGSVENVDQQDPDETITEDQFAQDIMTSVLDKAKASSDIWRRVGAVLIATDKQQLGPVANQGEPSAHSPWMEGDPRNIFHRGVGIEMSVFSHAEATLIAEAARRGVKLEGATIYVTTFPCPACAKLIAHSGIKKCYYKDGYAVLDGAEVLKQYGVKLTRVVMSDKKEPSPEAVPYKKSKS